GAAGVEAADGHGPVLVDAAGDEGQAAELAVDRVVALAHGVGVVARVPPVEVVLPGAVLAGDLAGGELPVGPLAEEDGVAGAVGDVGDPGGGGGEDDPVHVRQAGGVGGVGGEDVERPHPLAAAVAGVIHLVVGAGGDASPV